jgi:hypothetical protein
MATRISSQEVLAYLNQLGYNNINAKQLKDFVKDLKILIKYAERKKSEQKIETKGLSIPDNKLGYVEEEEPADDIFSTLHLQGTCASKAKVVPKKESVISVQIKKSKSEPRCKHHDNENAVSAEIRESKTASDKENVVSVDFVKSKENVKKSVQDEPLKENQKDNVKSSGSKIVVMKKSSDIRPKSAFIRPYIEMKHKSDPVALYHQYQANWKRQKVPGEANRTGLRWAIREKMLSGPRVTRT